MLFRQARGVNSCAPIGGGHVTAQCGVNGLTIIIKVTSNRRPKPKERKEGTARQARDVASDVARVEPSIPCHRRLWQLHGLCLQPQLER